MYFKVAVGQINRDTVVLKTHAAQNIVSCYWMQKLMGGEKVKDKNIVFILLHFSH